MPWCCCSRCMSDPQARILGADPLAGLAFAHGQVPLSGKLRARAEDFQVEEVLGFALRGAGEHLVLKVRKRGLNTLDVAARIAAWAGVRPVAVGFAGLKDRHALTVQYFSVLLSSDPLPADIAALEHAGLEVLEVTRHHRKLCRGELRGNRFLLELTHLDGDHGLAEERLRRIRTHGVPNYFGPQRFGHNASNLVGAQSLLRGQLARPRPEQRRMLLSAARSHVFNQVLSARVATGSWNAALPGEVLIRAHDRRQFMAPVSGKNPRCRVEAGELHPSGPLPGRPGHCLSPEGMAADLETAAITGQGLQAWCETLSALGLDADRRPLRTLPEDLEWEWQDERRLALTFALAAGCYATSVVRELMLAKP